MKRQCCWVPEPSEQRGRGPRESIEGEINRERGSFRGRVGFGLLKKGVEKRCLKKGKKGRSGSMGKSGGHTCKRSANCLWENVAYPAGKKHVAKVARIGLRGAVQAAQRGRAGVLAGRRLGERGGSVARGRVPLRGFSAFVKMLAGARAADPAGRALRVGSCELQRSGLLGAGGGGLVAKALLPLSIAIGHAHLHARQLVGAWLHGTGGQAAGGQL